MNKISTKKDFLQALEKELEKYFRSQEKKEILEDYESFFSEKEAAHESMETILDELGMPKDIANELAKERGGTQNLPKGIRTLLIGLWILVGLILFVKIQWLYLDSASGSVLVVMHIALFCLIFLPTASKHVQRKGMDKPGKSINILWVLLGFISPIMTFYNLIITRSYVLNPSMLPLYRDMKVSAIGPLFHYQILLTILVSFILLYSLLLKTEGRWFHFNIIFLIGTSILFLVILHAQLGNIVVAAVFADFLKAQTTTYITIILFALIIYGGLWRKARVKHL